VAAGRDDGKGEKTWGLGVPLAHLANVRPRDGPGPKAVKLPRSFSTGFPLGKKSAYDVNASMASTEFRRKSLRALCEGAGGREQATMPQKSATRFFKRT